ncbi:MAG: two component transcriptional regulator, LuxR family [Thermoleophilia bacterium]|nr:two component transcriptional regulator, LuxR family [Thermoleophilia bacterium]
MMATGSEQTSGAAASADTARVRVVLVDDHAVVRAGLASLLAGHDGIELAGQAGDVSSALEIVEIKRPDVVVLDIELGDQDALVDALPKMLSHAHKPNVLILSMHDDAAHVQAAFAAGAHGFLLKDAAEDDLLDAIFALSRGERYVHPVLGARLAQAASAGPTDTLTDRERQIVRLLALGNTNQEIAAQLFLSVRTIETHRSHIMGKLGLHSRAELVQWALDSGVIGAATR